MVQANTVRTTDRRTLVWRIGAVAGIVGGICYTAFVEAATLPVHGIGAFFQPFRQIGAVLLGPRALQASYDLSSAIAVGFVVHLAVAAAFGILIAWMTARFATLSTGGVIALGLVVGLALYALDVFILFPAAFPWFLDNDRLTQALGHAVSGAVTGAWLVWRGVLQE